MLLEVKDLRKNFDQKEVLHGISFQAQSGQALGLLGRNGAGKTTTIRILMNVFHANSGTVLLDGKPFDASQFKIGYMPEERGMYPKKKVLEQLIYFGELRGLSPNEVKVSAKELMKFLEIEEYADRKLETLSKGNQQKVQLAQTLLCSPDIIILDEPFSGLDPVNSQLLKDLIVQQINKGKLVIFSSHQMSYIEEFCEEMVILKGGEIVLGGNIKAIQEEMGEKKIMISAINYSNEEVKALCERSLSDIVLVHEIKKDFIVVELLNGYKKNDLLKKLIETDLDLEVFGDYKPSLTDIFILKAGENNETVSNRI